MNEHQLIEKMLAIFPGMTLGEDGDGQLIIYTDCRLIDGYVYPYTESES